MLAFFFGFSLSSLPLPKAGLSFGAALKVVVAADTVSIAGGMSTPRGRLPV